MKQKNYNPNICIFYYWLPLNEKNWFAHMDKREVLLAQAMFP